MSATRSSLHRDAPDPRGGQWGSRAHYWLLVAYVFLLPVQVDVAFLRLAPSDLILLLVVIRWIFGFSPYRHVRNAWSPWHVGLILVFATSTVVGLLQRGSVSEWVLVMKDIGLMGLFAGYAFITSEGRSWWMVRRMAAVLIVSTALQNAVAILAFMVGTVTGVAVQWINYEGVRLSGLLIDPNAYGGLLVLTLSIHLMTSCGGNPLVRGAWGTLITISMLLGVLLTYSRSAWIGLSACMLLVVILRPKIAVYVALAVVIAVAGMLGVLGTDYLSSMSNLAGRESQVTARMDMITEALPLFWQSPLLGIGLGGFEEHYGMVIHNTFIWIMTECGLVGLTVLLGFLFWFLWKSSLAHSLAPQRQKPLILGLAMASIAMMGLSMGIEALYQRHWWFVMALIASCYDLACKSGLKRL